MQLLVIALIILLLFGASRLGDVGKGLGEGIRNFKKGIAGDDDDKSKGDKSKPADEKRLSEGKSSADKSSADKGSAEPSTGTEDKPAPEERDDKA